jgi:eukaryotic translation initiation factor 2C
MSASSTNACGNRDRRRKPHYDTGNQDSGSPLSPVSVGDVCNRISKVSFENNNHINSTRIRNRSAEPHHLDKPHDNRPPSLNAIRSVVPDRSQQDQIPICFRPDSGGTKGQSITLYTNHFKCNLPDNLAINQYTVDVNVFKRDKWYNANKRQHNRFEIVQKILDREGNNLPFVWFDDGNFLYSRELLFDKAKTYEIKIKNQLYQLAIKDMSDRVTIEDMWQFVRSKTPTKRPQDLIRMLETLLKQTIRSHMICIRNQFFKKNQILYVDGSFQNSGFALGQGFYQAMFVTQAGLTLAIDTKCSCFYQNIDMLHFLSIYLRRNITMNRGMMSNEEKSELLGMQCLKTITIETRHTNNKMIYNIRGFGDNADCHLVILEGPDGVSRKMSVAQFFDEKYKIKLKYPRLPTLECVNKGAENSSYIPIELCFVEEWQIVDRSLMTTEQNNEKSKHSILLPEVRFNKIMTIVNERNFNNDPYLKHLSMMIDTNEMVQVKARILDPPNIVYRNNRTVSVTIGKWLMRGNLLQQTTRVQKWEMVLVKNGSREPGDMDKQKLNEFCKMLPETTGRYGIQMNSNFNKKTISHDQIRECIHNLHANGAEFGLFVLMGDCPESYQTIKRCALQEFGIIILCCDLGAIRKQNNPGKLNAYIENIAQKINACLGGINSTVSFKNIFIDQPKSNDDVFMFIGADVSHVVVSERKPSIAAVVASVSPASTQYICRSSEQRPVNNKKYSLEVIKDFQSMTRDLLHVFIQKNKQYPTKIVVYRDGVDEGHFQKLLDNEVQALKNACLEIYGNRPLPKITFVIIKKSHNTRFFAPDGQHITNMAAGTVIDTTIVHPRQFDFYLNSHAGGLGTNICSYYHVLYNEIEFTSDELQQLTFWLCHTDVRCTKAVKCPAAARYAHTVAYHSRYFKKEPYQTASHHQSNQVTDQDEHDLTLEDIKSNLIMVNKNVKDKMWFS